ncbi:MAG: glycosyltransferase family 9 protein [Candidatus Gastranaerophilales bacterium]|nr:glycosyltransferase family 9 protein [Candidatus Gastranaerophilales bacterium]
MIDRRKKPRKTKILVINFGGLGDEILFFPAIKTIKSTFPFAELTLVTEPRSKAAKDLNLQIDDIITCDIKGKNKYLNLLKLVTGLWGKNYKIVISSGSSKFISIILFLTGIKKRYGYYSGILSKLLLTKAIPLKKDQYAGNMYHDLIRGINQEEKAGLPDIDVSPENLRWAGVYVGLRDDKQVIAIHPGVSKLSVSKNMIKSWPVQNWVDLIVMLLSSGKYKVVLTGGPDDEDIIQRIRAEIAERNLAEEDFIDLYGMTQNISQLAAVFKLSDLLVCVDSAPMHVGVGVRTNTVTIFGPTDEKKLLPPGDLRFVAIKQGELDCRPCLWDKRQTTCDNPKCLEIDVERVYKTIEDQLS